MNDEFCFMIIIHNFWMESKGWEAHGFFGTFENAEKEAKALCFDRAKQFNKCSFYIQKV